MMIHDSVEMKPKYTSCSIRPQPRVSIHRRAVVACVNGKQYDMYLFLWNGEAGETQLVGGLLDTESSTKACAVLTSI